MSDPVPPSSPAQARPFGLICAIPEEMALVGDHFVETGSRTIAGLVFRLGRMEGVACVVVESGIGKVNAALVTTLLLTVFDCRAIVFSGVAGGLDPALGVGDVVIADRLVQHDYGAVFHGRVKVYQPGVPPMPQFAQDHGYTVDADLLDRVRAALADVTLPALPAAATGGETRVPRITFGTVLTGDQYVNDEDLRIRLHTTFNARAVEMEGAAIAQVAERFGVPVLVIRALSDLAGHDSHMDFYAFVHAAAAGAARLMVRLAPVV
ncbi:MAG: Mta [Pseudomonadota bacterium]|jgi:adenosylhomocysteine nucleosidase